MSRCLACSQENCGRLEQCDCYCHSRETHGREVTVSTKSKTTITDRKKKADEQIEHLRSALTADLEKAIDERVDEIRAMISDESEAIQHKIILKLAEQMKLECRHCGSVILE